MKNKIIIIGCCLLLMQCGHSNQSQFEAIPEAAMTTRDMAMQSKGMERLQEEEDAQQPSSTTFEQKIIKTGRITIEVRDYLKARGTIDTLIAQYKGVVSQENEDRSNYRLTNTLVIRLQPDLFDSFVHSVGTYALNIEHKSINTRDVTKQFIDLTTRLENKKTVVARYRELLKKASSVKDILEVEEALRKVTEEIESTQGQLRYLKDQVTLCTLYLTYYEQVDQTIRQKKGFFAQLGDSLVAGWRGLQALIIDLVGNWHIILFLGILTWGLLWFWRRRKHRTTNP